MVDINHFSPRGGRVIKEDNTVINEADVLTNSYIGYSTDTKPTPNVQPGVIYSFLEIDTKKVYFYVDSKWVKF